MKRFSNLYNLILSRRSVRLFKQKKVSLGIVKKIIDCARLAPSAANTQFIDYLVVDKDELKEKVFECLRFAAYISPGRNPPKGKRPMFYIILLVNKDKAREPNLRDIGASAENILISLLAFNLGGCWLQNIDKEKIKNILNLNTKHEIDSLIAAGYPDESPKLEADSVNVKYWLDKNNCLHVPKRPLSDVWYYNRIADNEDRR